MLRQCVLCNDANIEIKEDKTDVIGDPTEIALLVFAYKNGSNKRQNKCRISKGTRNTIYPRKKDDDYNSQNLDNNDRA